MTADDIEIGIGAIIETFEMVIFAFLHIKAFSYKPYQPSDPDAKRTSRWKSFLHVINFMETLRELWYGTVYMFNKMRGRETDMQARREAALEGVFGKTRYTIGKDGSTGAADTGNAEEKRRKNTVEVGVDVERTVHIGEERQWLGVGDDYGYGLGYWRKPRKERSESLADKFEREMESRGYGRRRTLLRYELILRLTSYPFFSTSTKRFKPSTQYKRAVRTCRAHAATTARSYPS